MTRPHVPAGPVSSVGRRQPFKLVVIDPSPTSSEIFIRIVLEIMGVIPRIIIKVYIV